MRTYTLKEVSKKINVSPGIIRQWEKDLEGLLVIPRTKQGARFYSKNEINQLMEIQQLYESHLGKDAVREAYEKQFLAGNEAEGEKSSEAPFPVPQGSFEAPFPVAEGEELSESPFPVAEGEESSEAHLHVPEENLTPVLANRSTPKY